MLINRPFNLLNRHLLWGLCSAVRRWRAGSTRTACANVWPIDENAGASPPGWPGWPGGKSFALVLTHDIEGIKGLSRVKSLMDLELKQGFHSSFNFIPEGEYRVPEALRRTLDEAGFEVGIRGSEHDGRPYVSKTRFASKAAEIRKRLEEWGACGFRSPLMQHRLAWLHQLGVEYDVSTFDTDPFEAESEGVGTVFPFWVPDPNGHGYVELPYTLPQDFTLFVLLRESAIDLWKRKLDWIAAHGGMALLITHPDCMSFDGKPERDEYPVSYYEEFLRYVREKYAGAFWSARPRDVASFYTASVPLASRNTRKRICMLAHTIYEADNRVRRYAEALAKRGDHVDVIALAHRDGSLGRKIVRGVSAHGIQHRDHNERHKWTYAWRLLRFLVVSSVLLTRLHHRVRYDVIHIHNVPDFLVFAAWYPKWTGAKLILDIHDIVPELFASKFSTGASDRYVRFLKGIEKLSASFVDHLIVSNHLWHEKLIARSISKEKCSVFVNHVDPEIFYRRSRTRNDGNFIILFPGTFQWHQGLEIAIKALAHLKDRVPNAEFHLYGGGGGDGTEARLSALAGQLGLNGRVKFFRGVSLDEMPDIIVNADLGVVPKRADSFGNEAYSTKIMEFMSQGVPVVASRTKIDSFYFDDTVLRFFPSGDDWAMAEAMLEIAADRALREALIARGYEYVNRNGWDSRKADYLELVDSLSVERS